MQKTVVKYVSGIPDAATSFQKKIHRKYNGKIGYEEEIEEYRLYQTLCYQRRGHCIFLIEFKMMRRLNFLVDAATMVESVVGLRYDETIANNQTLVYIER